MCTVLISIASLNNTVFNIYFFGNNTAIIYCYIEFNTKLILTERCTVFPACNCCTVYRLNCKIPAIISEFVTATRINT